MHLGLKTILGIVFFLAIIIVNNFAQVFISLTNLSRIITSSWSMEALFLCLFLMVFFLFFFLRSVIRSIDFLKM